MYLLGPDRNSGYGLVQYRWNLGWYQFRSGTGRFGRYQTSTAIFSCCIIGFVMSYLHHVPLTLYSSLAGSRAPLQFPECITCYPPVPRLHHVPSSRSLAVSRAPSGLEFPDCITCYPRVHKMYHAPPPLVTLGVENYLYFHRLLLLLISH